MRQELLDAAEAGRRIAAGRTLLLAGDKALLSTLPRGGWIAGTIPYFVAGGRGGMASRELLFATDITDVAREARVVRHDRKTLARVYAEAPDHGFSFLVIPAGCSTHQTFALSAPSYESFGFRPLVGWISGVHMDDVGRDKPLVFDGATGESLEDGAVVLHVRLPRDKVAEIGIVNIFEQGEGDAIRFERCGFTTRHALVNGVKRDFAGYIAQSGLDTRLPLVADYYGARVNTSFRAVDQARRRVSFYAPVFRGVTYRHARPVPDYVRRFQECLAQECDVDTRRVAFSCNCILNYLHSGLEGRETGPFTGPITFGEIAYQLLNQTLVYLEIKDLPARPDAS